MKLFEIPMVVVLMLGLSLLSGVDVPAARADFTFGQPVSTPYGGVMCFSADDLEVYFSANMAGGQGNTDLWVCKRASPEDDWGSPENLGPTVNSATIDFNASITADSLELYFLSNRPGGYGGLDIYVTRRATRNSPWGPPTNLGPKVNSAYEDGNVWVSSEGLELYFGSDRPGGSGAYSHNICDLYVSQRATRQDSWGDSINLGPAVNSTATEDAPCLSPDGLLLLFISGRPGGYGDNDLWMTKRAGRSAPWEPAVNLGPKINSSLQDTIPVLAPDGSTLHFIRGSASPLTFWEAPILPIVDFNADGKVDLDDLRLLIDAWGTDNALCDIGPHVWGDGKVDMEDLKVFIAEWEKWEKQNPPVQADFVFGTATNLGPPVNGPYRDAWSVLSSDGLELFFSSERSGGYGGLDIWVTKRATVEDPWGSASNLGPAINVSTYDLATSISPDGLTLYFCISDGEVMYTTSRPTKDSPWGPPSIMVPAIAAGGGAAGPVSADGLEFYFCSTRPGGYGDYDIWLSTRVSTSDAWGPGVNLGPTINAAAGEVPTWLSPDGLTLLLTSDRPGGYGGYDAWIMTRPSKGAAWGRPRNLGPSINTAYTDEITAISPDGRWCLLDDWLSPRPGGCGQWDIWQAPIIPTVDVNGDGKMDSDDLKVLTAD